MACLICVDGHDNAILSPAYRCVHRASCSCLHCRATSFVLAGASAFGLSEEEVKAVTKADLCLADGWGSLQEWGVLCRSDFVKYVIMRPTVLDRVRVHTTYRNCVRWSTTTRSRRGKKAAAPADWSRHHAEVCKGASKRFKGTTIIQEAEVPSIGDPRLAAWSR